MNKIENMYAVTRKLVFLLYVFFNIPEVLSCLDGESIFGDIHHHGPRVLCLRQNPNLEQPKLDHFLLHHIEPHLLVLDLSCQRSLNDNHLQCLAGLPQAETITTLNLENTNVTYEGIAALWRSPSIGRRREDQLVYDNFYNLPLSIVTVEIGNTPAMAFYEEVFNKHGKKIYPLPLRNNFEMVHLNPYTRRYEQRSGFKKILLTNHGKPIE